MDARLAPLRPHPHRGDLIAVGAVPLAVGVSLIDIRFDGEWGSGILLVLSAVPAALLLAMGLLAEREGEHPRAYQTILLVTGLALALSALVHLAEVLGADDPLTTSGSLTWIAAAFASVAAVPAWERVNSPICALIEVVAGGVALLAFVDWVFEPESTTTFRWLLLLLIGVYGAAHLRWREPRPRHAVHMVNAAGLAGIALAATFVDFNLDGGNLFGSTANAWWELVIAAVGFGLVAYAAVDREPGPAYLGAAVLVLFVTLAGIPGKEGASLIGWPLLLLLAGGAALAAGLRPLRPLPPPPDADRAAAPTEPLPPRPPGAAP